MLFHTHRLKEKFTKRTLHLCCGNWKHKENEIHGGRVQKQLYLRYGSPHPSTTSTHESTVFPRIPNLPVLDIFHLGVRRERKVQDHLKGFGGESYG